MSLLEDVFLEDEADEAQDLERIIEGDGYDHQDHISDDDDNEDGVGRDDEAEEDKRRVDPNSTKSKKVVKNPRFVLNPARLTGPRGIHVIPEHFKNFKFKGKGHEKEDLDMVLKRLEHWAYRLYPKFKFEDCLKKMELLGKKRPVMVNLHKIRSDQYSTEETIIQKDSSDDEGMAEEPTAPDDEDEFDKLLQQQIALAHTPAGKKLQVSSGDIGTPMSMPKATLSPSISEEQKHRMLQNRALAEQRRLAKLKQVHEATEMGGQVEQESVDLTANEKDHHEEGIVRKSIDKNDKVVIINDDPNNIHQEDSVDLTIIDHSNRKSTVNQSESIVNLTKKTGFPVSRKRTYKINDSDDESGKSDGESITLVNDTDILVSKRADIDKSVENKTVLTTENTVDLTETSDKEVKRMRKANIIDSSDEECDATAEDISITVDIHRENSQPQNHQISAQDNIDLINRLTNETTEGLFEKQKNIDIATIDVASDKKRNETNEKHSEEQNNIDDIVKSDERSNTNETSEHRSEKQNNVEKVDTSFNLINEDITEIRSEIGCDTASNSMLLEHQANTLIKKNNIIETTTNVHEENGNFRDNVAILAGEKENQESCENKISVDDVMDVDFSEDF